MPRLKLLRTGQRTLAPRVAYIRDAHGHAPAHEPWRKWYGSRRWKALRRLVLDRDEYRCQTPTCGRIEADTSQLVADHKRAHRGDPALFWDVTNLQTLCKTCHDSLKKAHDLKGAD